MPKPYLPPVIQNRFHLNGAWKQSIVLEMDMLLEIAFKCLKTREERDVGSASPGGRIVSVCKSAEFDNEMIGSLMLLEHDEDRI